MLLVLLNLLTTFIYLPSIPFTEQAFTFVLHYRVSFTGSISLHSTNSLILLRHVCPLLDNDREISDYTTVVAKERHVNSNRETPFSVRSVSKCYKQDRLGVVSTYAREALGNRPTVLITGPLYRSQCESGRSCDRPSRHRFSWFSSVYKQMLRCSQVPSCYCVLLMQPSRLKFIEITLHCCQNY
jgi:hypothetical protein